jgi:Xaa-Pro aminopeptidase
VTPCDKRIEFISGFTGSAGTALVTQNQAWLMTDGRYTIQAANQLNQTEWTVLQTAGAGLPTVAEHILNCLGANQEMKIGIDASTMPLSIYRGIAAKLTAHKVMPLATNPIDKVWEDMELRPPRPTTPSFVHPISLAGVSVASKLQNLRVALKTEGADGIVVSALDEVVLHPRH